MTLHVIARFAPNQVLLTSPNFPLQINTVLLLCQSFVVGAPTGFVSCSPLCWALVVLFGMIALSFVSVPLDFLVWTLPIWTSMPRWVSQGRVLVVVCELFSAFSSWCMSQNIPLGSLMESALFNAEEINAILSALHMARPFTLPVALMVTLLRR